MFIVGGAEKKVTIKEEVHTKRNTSKTIQTADTPDKPRVSRNTSSGQQRIAPVDTVETEGTIVRPVPSSKKT